MVSAVTRGGGTSAGMWSGLVIAVSAVFAMVPVSCAICPSRWRWASAMVPTIITMFSG